MVRRLRSAEDFAKIQSLWPKIFEVDADGFSDPHGFPFKQPFHFALIFFPAEQYWMKKRQFDAVMTAAKSIKDADFYMTNTENTPQFLEQKTNWVFEDPTWDDYLGLHIAGTEFVIENTLYSTTGQWAVYNSHTNHALVSGVDTFMKRLREAYPRWRKDLKELRKWWAQYPNAPGWIEEVVRHYEIDPDAEDISGRR